MVMVSLGEETRASCRGPSNHNAVALILPHKAMLGFDGGAIGADIYCDRSGIHARRLIDAAKVLDALKDPSNGYYDPRDPYTTVPRSTVLAGGYTPHVSAAGAAGALAGRRIGIVRESMLNPGIKLVEPITTAAAAEIRTVLGEHLGATLVESVDPLWTPDPSCEPMRTSFRQALARLVPVFMPELLFRLRDDGQPLFDAFAAAIRPTEFLPGVIFGTGDLAPVDYLVAMAEGRIEPPPNLDVATIQQQELATTFRFHISQYLSRRSADWAALGFRENLTDWATLNARSKFWGDDQRSAFLNWEAVTDPRNPLLGRQGVNERIMLRELLRRVDMMVLLENRLDALVRLHTPLPPGKIGGAIEPGVPQNLRLESFYGPNAGLTEILVPAGYVSVAYDSVFRLSDDCKSYEPTLSDEPTAIAAPGLPFSLVFRAEPGAEDVLLQIASAYEAASMRRIPPPMFHEGSLRRESVADPRRSRKDMTEPAVELNHVVSGERAVGDIGSLARRRSEPARGAGPVAPDALSCPAPRHTRPWSEPGAAIALQHGGIGERRAGTLRPKLGVDADGLGRRLARRHDRADPCRRAAGHHQSTDPERYDRRVSAGGACWLAGPDRRGARARHGGRGPRHAGALVHTGVSGAGRRAGGSLRDHDRCDASGRLHRLLRGHHRLRCLRRPRPGRLPGPGHGGRRGSSDAARDGRSAGQRHRRGPTACDPRRRPSSQHRAAGRVQRADRRVSGRTRMSARALNAAILGLGWWGRTIVATLRDSPALRIVAAFDPDPSATGVAVDAGIPVAASFDDILRDPAIEAVVLCTPHTMHADQIVRAAEAGKHVFCEKPLCLTRAEAAAAIAACERARVQLGVGHERRFEPPIIELRRMVAAGELGIPLQIEANFSQDKFLALPADNWRLSGAEAPAGPMTATGIHLLDLAVSFLGPAESVLTNVRQLGSQLRQRRHAGRTRQLSERRQRPTNGDLGDPVRRSFRRLRQRGLGRGAG